VTRNNAPPRKNAGGAAWFSTLVSFDPEIRLEPDIEIVRISGSGH